ncbi:MAG: 16S rRNA (cytidine(1402)-2'-O)-methyltransferase [Deltaproteobacteria bacterium]|nr:16S rRNA (cytidine(1402)-2'-O)-methyltransferase [Deltaproteobacteria bacterium]MBL7110817.1 16S rRNA (cytidine(1402)-2'-O)-methyltransferase [Bacteroidales bacterium]
MCKLYLVPTPIGNLDDITIRATQKLDEVDLILAEDTRRTKILLDRYKIQKKLSSYHAFNEHKVLDRIIGELKLNKSIALVTDAGTPGISDPGFLLIRRCLEEQIEVECLPGPTAFVPALVASGIPCDRFVFEGFLPAKKGRNKRLNELVEEKRTMIFYESPQRIPRTIVDLSNVFGRDRRASLSRELTKIHEETIRGSLEELAEFTGSKTLKGEIVLIVQGKTS